MKFIEIVHASPVPEETPALEVHTTLAEPTTETHATAEAQSGGVLGSLGINGTLFVSQLINFALVATILWFLILKPLTKKMAERQKLIDESLNNAKKVEENLAKSEENYQEKISAAKTEANKMIEKAVEEAEKNGNAIKSKAKEEIEGLVEQAKKNIRLEREEMKTEIKKETAEIVVMALERILSEKVTDKKDKDLINEMVKKLQ